MSLTISCLRAANRSSSFGGLGLSSTTADGMERVGVGTVVVMEAIASSASLSFVCKETRFCGQLCMSGGAEVSLIGSSTRAAQLIHEAYVTPRVTRRTSGHCNVYRTFSCPLRVFQVIRQHIHGLTASNVAPRATSNHLAAAKPHALIHRFLGTTQASRATRVMKASIRLQATLLFCSILIRHGHIRAQACRVGGTYC